MPAALSSPSQRDRDEVAALADYGPAPESWVRAPFYAYRVYRRRKELAEALLGRVEDAATARRGLEDALLALVERARPLFEGSAAFKREVGMLREAEALVRTRDAAVANEEGAHRERLGSIDARIATVTVELARAEDEENALRAEKENAALALARAEAKAKRAEIEQRGRPSGRVEP